MTSCSTAPKLEAATMSCAHCRGRAASGDQYLLACPSTLATCRHPWRNPPGVAQVTRAPGTLPPAGGTRCPCTGSWRGRPARRLGTTPRWRGSLAGPGAGARALASVWLLCTRAIARCPRACARAFPPSKRKKQTRTTRLQTRLEVPRTRDEVHDVCARRTTNTTHTCAAKSSKQIRAPTRDEVHDDGVEEGVEDGRDGLGERDGQRLRGGGAGLLEKRV